VSGARRPHDAGFTLVEVLIATVVMTIAVFGIMASFPTAYRSVRDSGRMAVLTHLAAQRAETIQALPYADSTLNTGTHPTQATDSSGAKYYAVSGYPQDYSLRWIVSNGPTNGAGGTETAMKTVVVEATYRTRYTTGGTPVTTPQSLQVTLQTFVTD
jgi:Tfp pilus assembly protein PilV